MAFSSVSVVGTGPVGSGIALACAAEGMPVTLIRASSGDRETIRARLMRRLSPAIDKGELTEMIANDILARIHVVHELGRAADGDLVIDTTVCEPRSRRAMLATLESGLSSGAVLATTAPESLAEIAEALRRPDQLVGMRLTLGLVIGRNGRPELGVELTVLPETAPGVIAAARTFCAMLRKPSMETASEPPDVGYREWLSVPIHTPKVPTFPME
jgi:3-hydroxyacyl-CoA dehydrogenase